MMNMINSVTEMISLYFYIIMIRFYSTSILKRNELNLLALPVDFDVAILSSPV